MTNSNPGKEGQGDGTDFIKGQRAVDEAKNERLRENLATDKIDPLQANCERNKGHKTDVSKKKTGGGKQSTPGT